MGLYAELQRQLPPFRFRFTAFPRLRALAEKLDKKYGGSPWEPEPAENTLERIRLELKKSGGDFYKLTSRDKRKVHWIIWSAPECWSENPEFMNRYLAWADQYWGRNGKIGVRRLWKHYLINFDRHSLATQLLAVWLADRHDRLPPKLGKFSSEWQIFDIGTAARKASLSILKDDQLAKLLEELNIKLQQSAFMLSALEVAGQLLLAEVDCGTNPPERLAKLLRPLGNNPIYKMHGSSTLKNRTVGVLVEGLVRWTERQASPNQQTETIRCLDIIVGDPRLHSNNWQPVREEIKETVIRWMSRLNLETFISIMNQLEPARRDQWDSRRAFWEQYLPYISKSWLIAGPDAKPIASRVLKESYGEFAARVEADHCGLMMQVSGLVIFEMNKNGSACFWEAGNEAMPNFFLKGKKYQRTSIIAMCPQKNRDTVRNTVQFSLPHKGNWPKFFRDVIGDRTGIRP